MNFAIQFVHPWIVLAAFLGLFLAMVYRFYYYQPPAYLFALTSIIKNAGFAAGSWRNTLLYLLRFFTLTFLALASGRPQLADTDSPVEIHGIDIMLVLDVSGSMILFDDLKDRRPRIRVAVEEAKNFIDKREHDQIGLVLFAADAVARLPLTLDKDPIKDVLSELEIGVINPEGTLLMTGIATAANRLRNSKAKSKIMILLTDGEPMGNDLPIQEVMDIVNKIGIKIYTIGIGGPEGGMFVEPGWGVLQGGAPLNDELLKAIAQMTGGRYFAAQRPEDLKKIYDTIDSLEKTEIETPLYTHYYELGIPLLLGALIGLMIEFLLRRLLWKMI